MTRDEHDKGQIRVIGYMSYELDDSPADACQPFLDEPSDQRSSGLYRALSRLGKADACIALRSLLQAFQLAH